jgi:hypothetical protein
MDLIEQESGISDVCENSFLIRLLEFLMNDLMVLNELRSILSRNCKLIIDITMTIINFR